MVKVTFVQASGDERTIEVPTGQSLMEAEMLEMHADHPEGERLSCQVPLTDELDGMIVDLPRSQF